MQIPPPARAQAKGRGTPLNPAGRFEPAGVEPFDDGWDSAVREAEDAGRPRTEVLPDRSRSVIVRNDSPDVGFEQSLNPYRGCEHGCIYCYARPSHAFLGLSSGLDFETRLFAKHDAAALLRKELAAPGYRCRPLALGTNTDPYQPQERRLKITRGVLEVLCAHRHPVSIVTKSAAVLRDLDLLAPMAAEGLARVAISVTTLQPALARAMEPRAAAPHRRLQAIAGLRAAGVPVAAMVAPIIPGLNDHEIEAILAAVAEHGALGAVHTLVRLPFEIKDLFADWLTAHVPDKAARVLALIRQCRGGRLNDPSFGRRMRGEGPFAELIARRMTAGRRRHGLDRPWPPLRTDLFEPPSAQLRLF
jgi:DNA repair photolyase